MPEYRVLRIEEQMYGCEELPAGQPVLCDVVLEGTDGACCRRSIIIDRRFTTISPRSEGGRMEFVERTLRLSLLF